MYLAHLILGKVAKKTLKWAHLATTPIRIKYFTNPKPRGKKPREDGWAEPQNPEWSPDHGPEGHWGNANTVEALLDGVWNLAAVTFILRPWDWSAFTVYRVCHDIDFFSSIANYRDSEGLM